MGFGRLNRFKCFCGMGEPGFACASLFVEFSLRRFSMVVFLSNKLLCICCQAFLVMFIVAFLVMFYP